MDTTMESKMDTKIDQFRSIWPQIGVNVDVRHCVQLIVGKLLSSDIVNELEFPSSFTSIERQFVHNYCQQMGLKTKSKQHGYNRYVTAYKPNTSTIIGKEGSYELSHVSQHQILGLLQRLPVSERERKDMARYERFTAAATDMREMNCTTGRLSAVIPQIPCPPPFATGREQELSAFRRGLIIWGQRNDIMDKMAANRVLVISGHSGVGKTTQVPQFILEYCNLMKKPCRIICAQPRRLSALTVSERVSAERGELIGQTVGYQIRLESKVSPRTLLTFCTNGVLLRTLMGGDNALTTVTHVILDELQERDRFSDFLLLVMRELIIKHRNVKLILMSTNMNLQLLTQYFGRSISCHCIEIKAINPLNEIRYLFLEDILKMIDYMPPAMKKYKESLELKNAQKFKLNEWCSEINVSRDNSLAQHSFDSSYDSPFSSHSFSFGRERAISESVALGIVERIELDAKLRMSIDNYLRNAWFQGTDTAFYDLLEFITKEQISVDYQHSESGVTPLIAATCHNKFNIVETLLSYGANVQLSAPNDWDPLKWAKHFRHKELAQLLEAYWKCNSDNWGPIEDNSALSLNNFTEFTSEQRLLLDIYYNSFNDNGVDFDLICSLMHFICINCDKLCPENKNGSILIYLPGYDEIIKLRERILSDIKHFDPSKYVLFTIHSQMPSTDLKRMFKRYNGDVRKIILSTSIAETTISIDDVVYVIDCGKVREKIHEIRAEIESEKVRVKVYNNEYAAFKSVWISKSNAIQRQRSVGKSNYGYCYHLYDRSRYACLDDFCIPDMLRMSIHELCLQTKLLWPTNIMAADYLAKAFSPPKPMVVRNSVQLLKTIDAFDSMEQLTELGLHLLDLPIEPNLGKMVLYSVVLKCLDPVLTIVCALAYCDPFLMPSFQAARKRTAAAMRRKLSAGTYSDHITLLRGFQSWQKARHDGYEKSFCEQNFISSSTMEMIVGMRAQLLGQLRASGFVRARGAGDIRDLNSHSENWSVIKAALCGGGYPNIMRIDHERNQLITRNEVNVRFHPSSVFNTCTSNPRDCIYKTRAKSLQSLPTDWLLFENITKVEKFSYARCCTLITPITVALFAGNAHLSVYELKENTTNTYGTQFGDQNSDSESEDKNDRSKHVLKIDNWMSFKIDRDIASLTLQLRQKWHALFLRRMAAPSKPMTPADDTIIKAIVEVLTVEEQQLGLQQPVGIGQRPRPMSTDFCPPVSNAPLNSPINKNPFQLLPSGRQLKSSPISTQHFAQALQLSKDYNN